MNTLEYPNLATSSHMLENLNPMIRKLKHWLFHSDICIIINKNLALRKGRRYNKKNRIYHYYIIGPFEIYIFHQFTKS